MGRGGTEAVVQLEAPRLESVLRGGGSLKGGGQRQDHCDGVRPVGGLEMERPPGGEVLALL